MIPTNPQGLAKCILIDVTPHMGVSRPNSPDFGELYRVLAIVAFLWPFFVKNRLREVPIGGFKLGTQALEYPSRPLRSYTLKETRPEAGYPKIKSCV